MCQFYSFIVNIKIRLLMLKETICIFIDETMNIKETICINETIMVSLAVLLSLTTMDTVRGCANFIKLHCRWRKKIIAKTTAHPV